MGSVRWEKVPVGVRAVAEGMLSRGLCVSGETVSEPCERKFVAEKPVSTRNEAGLEPAHRGVPETVNNQELCKPVFKTLVD